MWTPPSSFPISSITNDAFTSNSSVDRTRQERLQQLQQAVQNGTYHVDTQQIAKIMVERGVLNGNEWD
ncbi:flagellar biosynthesis anti-sigma factor FlgM [Alicyclobacillus mali (ex Roth et al. 2021)]|uniref:flagellar biosynthesis anti-sigma factor FlgM n=1 Tax=Alicyclobacillus mali (ex Roth et al. 2021) TaxID=1123961 RepID=UPI001A8E2F5F|nr:flagellar biosynthesis anti-sigma factor FlgM [Alicyclobacillus mali (ex Roth et al. 2021)]